MSLSSGSLTLFHVRGVPVRAHWTLLLALVWMTVLFSTRFAAVARLSGVDPQAIVLPPLAWGLLVALGLFASVAVHEMVHTLIALRAGGRVKEITLMLLGGVSQMEQLPRRPSTEAVMAGAGPVASLAIGVILMGLVRLGLPLPPDVHLGIHYLAQLNIVLGIFNLLPAFPMDGGRVLRALLSLRLGPGRATRAAARIGKAAAVAFGLWAFVGGGFFMVFLALFLYTGAEAEARAQNQRDALSGLRVADVMSLHPATIHEAATLERALEWMRDASRLDLIVVDARHRPIGVLYAADVARVPRDKRNRLRVGDLGPHLARRAIEVHPEEDAATALERAAHQGATYLFAVEHQELVGLLGRAELENVLALHAMREGPPATATPREA